MDGGVKGEIFSTASRLEFIDFKDKEDKTIVPEDRTKFASKNGATFWFFLRSLKHCRTNKKIFKALSIALVFRFLCSLGSAVTIQMPKPDTNPNDWDFQWEKVGDCNAIKV